MKKTPRIKIFVSHHKPGYIYEDDIYVPIQVGKENAKIDLGILGDNTGDNISNKNSNYAELTAQYRVWKNYDLSNVDYVGFCHYRRYMTYCYRPNLIKYLFEKNPFTPGAIGSKIPWYRKIKAWNEGNCLFNYDPLILQNNNKDLYDFIKNNTYDLYTVKREPIVIKSFLSKLNIKYNHPSYDFCFGNFNGKNELKDLFFNTYPNYKKIKNLVLQDSEKFYPLHRHVFIMKKDLFLDYAKFLFQYLFEAEKYFKYKNIKGIYYENENRIIGIFAETFINYWKIYNEEFNNIKSLSKSNYIFFK